MDKKIIETVFDNLLHNKTLQTIPIEKCRPKWLSKPTTQDKAFIETFLQEDGKGSYKTYHEGNDEDFKKDLEKQIEYENKKGFTEEQKDAVAEWGDDGYEDINGKIYNTEEFRDKKKNGFMGDGYLKWIDDNIEALVGAIEDGPNISVDRILYRGGHWDDRVKVGDVVTQDGFTSLTYNEEGAEDFIEVSDSPRYFIEFYVPSDTKGVWVGEPFDNMDESEYLTPPGTRYYVFDVDKDSETAKVVVLP